MAGTVMGRGHEGDMRSGRGQAVMRADRPDRDVSGRRAEGAIHRPHVHAHTHTKVTKPKVNNPIKHEQINVNKPTEHKQNKREQTNQTRTNQTQST